MSYLAGWQGAVDAADPDTLLHRMGEPMGRGRVRLLQHLDTEFACLTTEPAVGQAVERLAASPDGAVRCAFAGCLFTEDPGELRRPAGHCLALYLRHGPAFAAGLNGSYAIVIHDQRSGALHLVTDRLGTRAIFYTLGPPFLFGSEVKALLEFPGVRRDAEPLRLAAYLLCGQMFGPDTYYNAILRAPEASVTTWDGQRASFLRYWDYPVGVEPCRDLEENARRAYAALQNATRRACLGAERPALMLSGGLDSRAIASCADRRLLCLTVHREAGPEVRTARRVARRLGHGHQFVPVPDTYPWELVEEGTLIGDGVHSFVHAQGLYLAGALAASESDVLLTGCCLEEVFKCQAPRADMIAHARRSPSPGGVIVDGRDLGQEYWLSRTWSALPRVRELLPAARLDEAVEYSLATATRVVRRLAERITEPARLYSYATQSQVWGCDGFLNVLALDRLAPARLVAADNELRELAYTIPPEQRRDRTFYTTVFTRVDRRCRWIPYNNTGLPVTNSPLLLASARRGRRLARLGERVVERLLGRPRGTKRWASWPKAELGRPEWRGHLGMRLAESRLADLGVVRGDALRALVARVLDGEYGHWGLVARWLTMEEWLARHG